jgi:hypothetical protein
MNIVRIAMAIVLLAGATCSVTGCDDPFKNVHFYIPFFGK